MASRRWVTMKQIPPDGDWQKYAREKAGDMTFKSPEGHIWEVGFNDGSFERFSQEGLLEFLNKPPAPTPLQGDDKSKEMTAKAYKEIEETKNILQECAEQREAANPASNPFAQFAAEPASQEATTPS